MSPRPNPPPLTIIASDDAPAMLHHTERVTALSRLLPLWPGELADTSLNGRRVIVRRLAKALRAERQRGRGGHWAYSLARHAALAKALQAEHAALIQIEAALARINKTKGPR